MSAVERTLARIHARLRFSAPAYLGSAAPAKIRGEETYRAYLVRVRQAYARAEQALAEALRDRRAPVDTGTFPLRFAAWNDLSPKYLAGRIRQELIADREALITLRRTLPEFSPENRSVDQFAAALDDEIRAAEALFAAEKKT
jgi:hypothetical protein